MMREEGKKTVSQLIINTLMTGKTLRARDVSSMVSEAAGKEIKVQDVSNMLYRISDSGKCDLGHFVNRMKQDNRYVYSMVEDALKLSEKQAYGLYLKVGKDRYSLDTALEEYPDLKKFVGVRALQAKTKGKKRGRKPGRPPGSGKQATEALELSMDDTQSLATALVKAAGAEGLNINLNVTFKFGG